MWFNEYFFAMTLLIRDLSSSELNFWSTLDRNIIPFATRSSHSMASFDTISYYPFILIKCPIFTFANNGKFENVLFSQNNHREQYVFILQAANASHYSHYTFIFSQFLLFSLIYSRTNHTHTFHHKITYNVFLILEMLKRRRSICCKMALFVGSDWMISFALSL